MGFTPISHTLFLLRYLRLCSYSLSSRWEFHRDLIGMQQGAVPFAYRICVWPLHLLRR